jgi:hypothetical protein
MTFMHEGLPAALKIIAPPFLLMLELNYLLINILNVQVVSFGNDLSYGAVIQVSRRARRHVNSEKISFLAGRLLFLQLLLTRQEIW